MKWSDGQPYTADDIMFWWEVVCLNPELLAAAIKARL
jgi:peptide/nickel transport system substrate-binding protein